MSTDHTLTTPLTRIAYSDPASPEGEVDNTLYPGRGRDPRSGRVRGINRSTTSKLDLFIHVAAVMLAVVMGLIIVFMASRSAHASQVYLKNATVITGEKITLGDIFGGLEGNSGKVLGPAPQPGKDMVLGARTLLRIALALDLPWRPSGNADRITLTRAATVLGEETISDIVVDYLKEHESLRGNFDIVLASGDNRLILPYGYPETAEVVDMTFDRGRGWFQVTMAAPDKNNPVRQFQAMGSVRKIVSVPVLRQSLRNGDLIRASDIEWIDMYEKDIQHDFLLSEEDLTGLTPRRMVTSGKPVREMELEAPQIVSRGENVMLVYQHGTLRLTAEGRALRSGAKGEFVRVVNNTSSRTVEGVVTAPRTVLIK